MTYKKSRAEAGEDARWKKTQAKRRRNRKKKEAIIKAEAKRKAKVVTDNLKWQYETEEWNELRERILSRDGNLSELPDDKFVKFEEHFFPGTMIYARINIKGTNLENG